MTQTRETAGTTWRARHMRGGAGALALAWLMATAGCGSDDGGGGSGTTGADGGSSGGGCVDKQGAGGLDRSAKLDVKLALTGATVPATVSVNSGAMTNGQETDTGFLIKNSAQAAVALELIVNKIQLKYANSKGENDKAFQCFVAGAGGKVLLDGNGQPVPCEGYTFDSVIPPGFDPACASRKTTDAVGFVIRYKKFDDDFRKATVLISATGDTSKEVASFDIATKAGKAQITVLPSEVDFGVSAKGVPTERQMKILNGGDAVLRVTGLKWPVPDPTFQLMIGDKPISGTQDAAFDPPIEITPGSNYAFQAVFTAEDDKGRYAEVEFTHNAGASVAKAALKGNFDVPCVLVSPDKTLDMGVIYVGQTAYKAVTIKNCGVVDVELSAATLSDDTQGVFGLKDVKPMSPTSPLKIAKNKSEQVQVACTPPSENKDASGKQQPFTAKLNLSDNSTKPQKTIEVKCYGTAATCPTPVIVPDPGEEMEPLGTLKLKGSSSFAAPGKVVKKFKWQNTKAPAGATGLQFFPTDTSADVTFGLQQNNPKTGLPVTWLTVAGEYCFKLTTWDDAGTESCQPAEMCVLVIPSVALHVELLWDTPADTTKDSGKDAEGSDLDLHFVHPKAYGAKLCDASTGPNTPCQPDLDKDGQTDPWFNGVYDCYWYNMSPSWGNAALGDDNPAVDLDDTNGWGPENTSLVAPEVDSTYGVGVHYWDSHKLFPDDTTATVNIYILGALKGSFTQLLHQCDMWWVSQVDWPSGNLKPFQGADLPAPSAGKITKGYWSIVATSLGGECKKPK